MGYTVTTDRATGYVVTAADWNILEDNSTFLFGDTAWTNVAVQNAWTASGFTPRFILLGRTVHIQGTVTGGALSTAAFTLPVGYRPSQQLSLVTSSNAAFGVVQINTVGTVVPVTGSTTFVSCFFTFSVV